MRLQILVASTREGRKGPAVASWFEAVARRHGGFEVEVVDLAEVDLPMFDEPKHPRLGEYERASTRAFSTVIDRADAFVIVTPEYNHAPPPSLVNAFDHLSREWGYKPLAFVSYGGVSGGTRGVQVAKQIALALRMIPIVDAVHLPFFAKAIDEDGTFAPGEVQEKAARAMLHELGRWATALAGMREEAVAASH